MNGFNSIILIDYLNDENLMNKINIFEKMKNFSLPNCMKILVNLDEDVSKELKSQLKEKEIEYCRTIKNLLTKFINELILEKEKDIIKYINIKKSLKNKAISNNNIYKKEKNLKNESDKSDRSSDSYEGSFLTENDFGEKIFNLLNMIKEYNRDDIEKINDLLEFLNSESQKLKNVIDEIPLITYQNKNEYFAVYYYYLIISLLRIYESYKHNNNNENLGEYNILNNNEEGKGDNKQKEINNNEESEELNKMVEIRNTLESKIKNIKK